MEEKSSKTILKKSTRKSLSKTLMTTEETLAITRSSKISSKMPQWDLQTSAKRSSKSDFSTRVKLTTKTTLIFLVTAWVCYPWTASRFMVWSIRSMEAFNLSRSWPSTSRLTASSWRKRRKKWSNSLRRFKLCCDQIFYFYNAKVLNYYIIEYTACLV